MFQPLSQSTSINVAVGPFVNPADGVTPLTTLTAPANTVVGLITGGTLAAYTVVNWTALGLGYYSITLSTTDTATIGALKLVFLNPATFAPVEMKYTVLSQPVYNSLFGTVALSTYTGVSQTGDSFTRIGVAGAGLTAIGDTRLSHLDTNVSSIPNAAANAAAVVNVAIAGSPAGSIGAALVAAGSSGDPLSATVPGQYPAGTAGNILGELLTAIATRSTYAGQDTSGTTTLLQTIGTPASASIASDIATANAALAVFAGLYNIGTVSSVNSASSFTVNFAHSITASDLINPAPLQLCFSSVDRSPAKGFILTATQVDATHVALTFGNPFSTPPSVNDAVLVI